MLGNLPSGLQILLASNEKWVVPAGQDERRYFILDVSRSRVSDKAYFNKLWGQLENGGYEAMLYDLLARDISKFEHRYAPVTSGLMEQKKLSMPDG